MSRIFSEENGPIFIKLRKKVLGVMKYVSSLMKFLRILVV
jgi:hypothetical protein